MPSRNLRPLRPLIACIALATCISTALAAASPPLHPGARVRVTITPQPEPTPPAHAEQAFLVQPLPKTITGDLVSLTDTDITLATTTYGPPETVSLDEVDTLELCVQRGRRTRGALIGLGTGALAGVLIGLAAGDDEENDDTWSWELTLTAGEKSALAAVILAPVGALVGALVAPGERWEPVSGHPIDVGVTVGQPGGNGVYVAVRF
ncbi:MAG: hypothetical protein PHQ53_00115 [Candidatus Krumholzibacteria bacterium]|nr:hypothetical protein [Candidatus Krumholzibacteria bacterium]